MQTALLWALIKPSNLILYLAILGVVLFAKPIGKRLLLVVALILIAITVIPISVWLTRPLESMYALPERLPPPTGIIVLSGSEKAALTAKYGEPMLSKAGDRLTTFLRLSHQYPDARLVHAGTGNRYDGVSQSDVARQVILGAGVSAKRVVFSNRSRNTCQDARYAKEDLQPGENDSWILVTSASHMPRAVACFQAVDWPVIPYPTDFTYGSATQSYSMVSNLANLDAAVHEWLGLFYYRIAGQTRTLLPTPQQTQ